MLYGAVFLVYLLGGVSGAGPPTGYAMHPSRVIASHPVCANGRSRLIRLARERPAEADAAADLCSYRPGHVLALELDDAEGNTRRGPYTVSRADDELDTLDVIYRVIDPTAPVPSGGAAKHSASHPSQRKSSLMAKAVAGDRASLGGRFHTPIWAGMQPAGLRAAILISSGVGVGPQLGFVEQCASAWHRQEHASPQAETRAPGPLGEEDEEKKSPPPLVRLFAGYRCEGDVVCAQELDRLAAASGWTEGGGTERQLGESAGAFRRFTWAACLSAEVLEAADASPSAQGTRLAGRTSAVAPSHVRALAASLDAPLSSFHFHLIGRGSMVKEWQEGLRMAGIPEERVSHEIYFGHVEQHSEETAAAIARTLSGN
jgi:hypothetical protein